MQTSLVRRQRRRRAAARRRPAQGGSVVRRLLVAIPIILVLVAMLTGAAGTLFTVAAYNYYAAGLPDPIDALTDLEFEQQTIVYDRTGEVELARLGSLKREVVTFDQIPDEMLDATTAIEDQDFWINPGFDPVGIVSAGLDTLAGNPRGASTITQQLVRARLLPAEAFEDGTYERKIREIIQSIRLTQAYPGDKGKQDIITAYLNQNFYGNNSYGVKAAAKSYFGLPLEDLSLAQYAILAAIPQSPTKFDLVRNAVEICLDDLPPEAEPTEEAPEEAPVEAAPECEKSQLEVPPTSEIAIRRDYVLELMKTNSPLTGDRYDAADFEAAKDEPIVIQRQVSATWRAPQFVWQVRDALAEVLCPDDPQDCTEVDTGGYRVTTTLDWEMQKIVERYVYAAARAPHSSDPQAVFDARKIPAKDRAWIMQLRGSNIHNAASAVMDYRTGEVLAYVGSASYTAKGTAEFAPEFDVLEDGFRQPGSSIKPINYVIGIEDETVTASTMFMDVVTDFGGGYTPTQADSKERGPVRLRPALQFSLNVPALKSTIITGLDQTFERGRDFGLRYLPGAIPVTSMGIGTVETTPIDLIGAYGTIANGGVRMPRTYITSIVDDDLQPVWPPVDESPLGEQVVSEQAAFIITDILAGNTIKSVNPYWADWAIYDGSDRRPAAYKTGTTNDNKDVHAYGYLAPPEDPDAPALVVGVWMGNNNSEPNKGSLSLDSSAPLWSAITTAVSKGTPIASFRAPDGLSTATVDAFTGLAPGPFTTKTVKELFLPGTEPKERETIRVAMDIDEASGLRWQDGCVGPKVSRGFMDLSKVESGFENWQTANRGWAARAARGTGVAGGPEGTRTSYFYDNSFAPFGKSWGAPFAPTATCPLAPPPCGVDPVDPDPSDDIPAPTAIPCPTPTPGPTDPGGGGGGGGGGEPTPKPTKKP